MTTSLSALMLRSQTAQANAPDNFTRPADVLSYYTPRRAGITTVEGLQADPVALYNTPDFGETSHALLTMGLLDEVARLQRILDNVNKAMLGIT
jgi:hypothetical protein